MNIAKSPRAVPLFIAVLLLTACGFHLRGYHKPTNVAAVSVYIQIADNGDIAQAVRAQLKGSEARVVKEAESAEYILHLGRQKLTRRVLSVSARTGKAEEYQLVLTITMSVSKPGGESGGETGGEAGGEAGGKTADKTGGETLTGTQTVKVSQDYSFDQSAVLGQSSEEDELLGELADQAAREILRRLDAATQQPID